MEIHNSVLSNEINNVINNGPTLTNYSYDCMLHYQVKGKEEVLKPFKLVSLVIRRNYIAGFADEITAKLLVPLGQYTRRIYPSRNTLQLSLSREYLGEFSKTKLEKSKNIKHILYTAILLNPEPSVNELKGTEVTSERELDLVDFVEVDLQLIPKAVEKIRLIQIGGVYKKTTVDNLMQGLLLDAVNKVVVNNTKALKGIDIMPVANKATKDQIIVPHGTSIVDLPGYLQKKIGVYSTGLGAYIQDDFWYVFRLFDTTKFNTTLNTCTLIILPRKKYPNIERTFVSKNGSRTILITGDSDFADSNNTDSLTQGNGARFSDAGKMMESGSSTKDNKTIISRAKTNSEFTTNKKKEGVNYTPTTSDKITSNPFAQFSNVAARNGGYLKVNWQNCVTDLLTPGIVTRILFEDDNKVKEYYGTLLMVDYISGLLGGLTSTHYNHQAVLTFFVNKK